MLVSHFLEIRFRCDHFYRFGYLCEQLPKRINAGRNPFSLWPLSPWPFIARGPNMDGIHGLRLPAPMSKCKRYPEERLWPAAGSCAKLPPVFNMDLAAILLTPRVPRGSAFPIRWVPRLVGETWPGKPRERLFARAHAATGAFLQGTRLA